MTPDKPQDPQKGKVEETTPEEAQAAKEEVATEAAAQPEATESTSSTGTAKPKRTRAKKAAPQSEDQAAAETGVDKAAAAATEKSAEKAGEKTATRKRGEKAAAGKPTEKAAAPARKRDRRARPEPGVLVRAQARYVRTSARKARLVCDHIRGKDVVEARAILAFTPRAAAKPWLKLLESAVANAEHNHELIGEELRIASVHADEGPTLKRFRPRAMGRATRIRKRTSHLTITLTPKES
jgi:ribosomal protein L22